MYVITGSYVSVTEKGILSCMRDFVRGDFVQGIVSISTIGRLSEKQNAHWLTASDDKLRLLANYQYTDNQSINLFKKNSATSETKIHRAGRQGHIYTIKPQL